MSSKSEVAQRVRAALAEFEALAAAESGLAVGVPFSDTSDAELLAATARLGAVVRVAQASLTEVISEVNYRSLKSRGNAALVKREGYASVSQFLSDITGLAAPAVSRMIRVGEATYRGRSLDGEPKSARHPFVAEALAADAIGVDAADLIANALDRASNGGSLAERRNMEEQLVCLANDHPLAELRVLCERAVDVLDPDGARPRGERQREARSLTMHAQRDGMTLFKLLLPPEDAAIVRTGVMAVARRVDAAPPVESAAFFMGHTRNANDIDGNDIDGNVASDGCTPDGASYDLNGRPIGATATLWAQKLADAAVEFFRHGAQCTETGPDALPVFRVVVRIGLDELLSGVGSAELDAGGRLDAGQVRRIAASAGLIPVVLGGDSLPLDVGHSKRFFTRAQRIALHERDGNCAWPGCLNLFSDAHHIRWWEADHGPTDLNNGVMLCSSHHHRIHDSGWKVEVRPPDSDPNGPPVPHFIAPRFAAGSDLLPGAVRTDPWTVTLRGGRAALSPAAA